MTNDDNPLPDLLERKICDALRGIICPRESAPANRATLNAKLRDVLADLGGKLGYGVYPSSQRPGHASEWVYDIIWLEQSNGINGFLQDVPLVCESELGSKGEASDDFQRLLLCRARHRLMVYAVNKPDDLPVRRDDFIKEITECKLSEFGDRYILAGWVWSQPLQGFDLFLYVVGVAG